MENKIAVVIRGQFRTWNFCKHQTFHVFESRYPEVDWYFISWEDSVTDSQLETLHKDFKDRNATIKILVRDDTGNNSWNSQRRLGYELLGKMDDYTQIFEMRPDVYLEISDTQQFPSNNTQWYVTGLRTRKEVCRESDRYVHRVKTSINDWFYVQNPFMLQKFTESYTESMKLEGPRAQLVDVALRNNIEINDISDVVTPWVLRPTYTPNTLFGHEKIWMGMTSKQKIELLHALNISPQDYKTNNRFISL